MAVVDAKAGMKADKREVRVNNADKNILGAAAAGMGNRRCGPGAGALSFGYYCASDKCAVLGVLRHRDGGAGVLAFCRTSVSVSGRSSSATVGGTPVGAPALGD